jgi:hydrogenase maturation protease
MTSRKPLLVLGLGNILCSDDGLGAIAVNLLDRSFERPREIEVLDGGTLGLALLPYLEEAETAILVDAIRADAPAGTLVRLEGADVAPAVEQRLSPHQIGVADLLDGVRWLDRYPQRLVLLGVVPATLELGVGCSPAVRAALPALVERLADEIRGFGFDLVRRMGNETAGILDGDGVAGVLGLRSLERRSAASLSTDPGP